MLVGGDAPERWDYLDCSTCRIAFEYRHSTRALQPLKADPREIAERNAI